MSPLPDDQALTSHFDLAHRLAASLVGESDADDQVQDAYVAALERRPWAGADDPGASAVDGPRLFRLYVEHDYEPVYFSQAVRPQVRAEKRAPPWAALASGPRVANALRLAALCIDATR